VEVGFESGNYVNIPFELNFGEIKFPNVEIGLLDRNNTGIPVEQNMVFEYYNETIKLTKEGKANVDISFKMIFQTFYETDKFNISKLGDRSHIEIQGLGASPINIGSLKLSQGDIRIRTSIPGKIENITKISVRYENEGSIPSTYAWEAGSRRMFHILLSDNLNNFIINDSAIFLDISYAMKENIIESFYSKDMKKQEMQIRFVPICYIFNTNYNIELPEEIQLLTADNLQGFGNNLYFNQVLISPNEIKTFNIEYLNYLSDWERILNDPLLNLFWAGVSGFIGALLGVIIGFRWKKTGRQYMERRIFRILSSLHEESNMGWIWIPDKSREFIQIQMGENPPIVCQARILDENFKRLYNNRYKTNKIDNPQNTIIMSDYYRSKLNVEKNKDYELIITKANSFLQKLSSFRHHPDDVVKIATILAIISIVFTIFLGTLSIILAILSYFK
jgi:hypothetical protein